MSYKEPPVKTITNSNYIFYKLGFDLGINPSDKIAIYIIDNVVLNGNYNQSDATALDAIAFGINAAKLVYISEKLPVDRCSKFVSDIINKTIKGIFLIGQLRCDFSEKFNTFTDSESEEQFYNSCRMTAIMHLNTIKSSKILESSSLFLESIQNRIELFDAVSFEEDKFSPQTLLSCFTNLIIEDSVLSVPVIHNDYSKIPKHSEPKFTEELIFTSEYYNRLLKDFSSIIQPMKNKDKHKSNFANYDELTVGKDLSPGIKSIFATGKNAFYIIYTQDDKIIRKISFFSFVHLKKGQRIKLIRCRIN